MDSAIDFPHTYPLDSDLSSGKRYPTFEQPGTRCLNSCWSWGMLRRQSFTAPSCFLLLLFCFVLLVVYCSAGFLMFTKLSSVHMSCWKQISHMKARISCARKSFKSALDISSITNMHVNWAILAKKEMSSVWNVIAFKQKKVHCIWQKSYYIVLTRAKRGYLNC